MDVDEIRISSKSVKNLFFREMFRQLISSKLKISFIMIPDAGLHVKLAVGIYVHSV